MGWTANGVEERHSRDGLGGCEGLNTCKQTHASMAKVVTLVTDGEPICTGSCDSEPLYTDIAASSGSSSVRATMLSQSRALGANTPWYLMRLNRGGGTRSALSATGRYRHRQVADGHVS